MNEKNEWWNEYEAEVIDLWRRKKRMKQWIDKLMQEKSDKWMNYDEGVLIYEEKNNE